MSFGSRAALSKCPISKRLFEIMEMKKSNLCLAADVNSSQSLLKLAKTVGPHIAILKTHIDIISDFNNDIVSQLKKIAKKMNFLLMEDRYVFTKL